MEGNLSLLKSKIRAWQAGLAVVYHSSSSSAGAVLSSRLDHLLAFSLDKNHGCGMLQAHEVRRRVLVQRRECFWKRAGEGHTQRSLINVRTTYQP